MRVPLRLEKAPILLLALLSLLLALPRDARTQPAGKTHAVLLFDGRLAPQVALDAAVREALAPHAERVELRTMHAGRAETVPFLRAHRLTRADAPLLLVVAGPADDARILKRVALRPSGDPADSARTALKALGLPLPRLQAPAAGQVVAAMAADGSAAEKQALVDASGAGEPEEGRRRLTAGGRLVYRLRLPEALRDADLRVHVGGNYLVEWGASRQGPWNRLMDSFRYFGAAEELLRDVHAPTADLSPALAESAQDLFVRVRTNGRGTDEAVLARIEVLARGRGEKSGEEAWRAEADRLRGERLGPAAKEFPNATPLSGVLRGAVTLEKSRSPYLLTGDITVPPGSTLTIQPGVEVRILGRPALRVAGNLVARGTAGAPIFFAPARPEQPDDWRGIHFAPVGDRPAGAESVLQYCRIVNAAAVTLDRFHGEVSHCILEGGLNGLVLRNGGAGRLHHNRFLRCVHGLSVEGGAGEVRDSEWIDCLVAVRVGQPPAEGFRFSGNVVRGSRQVAVHYARRPGAAQPPLLLGGSFWQSAPNRLQLPAEESAEVRLDPRLEQAPGGAGPGW